MTTQPPTHDDDETVEAETSQGESRDGISLPHSFVVWRSRHLMALADPDESDRRALTTPEWFIVRFGFDASDIVREQVLRIQKQYGFSNRQIKILKHSGVLRIQGAEVILEARAWHIWVGWVFVSLMILYVFPIITAMMLASHPTVYQLLNASLACAVFGFTAMVAHLIFVHANRLVLDSVEHAGRP